MKHKKILGWGIILIGSLMGIGVGLDFILREVTEPGRTIYGLLIFFGVVIPLILTGSILSETAPDFIMKKVNSA